ncbi:T9SS type A sorting domain-containing protein [Aquimarina sp. 2201CG14-23]|uniref:T9SS type A sorting domain-containing protein n=1 Tax=Aquimarina mycalae TaxID=3040073 RepID=UPI0024780C4E|nr:T9SS type A sorting domain-containing protein [Aquimarina sp. 2201CG14-23]MDH7446304.1 T9SS type A sorting domain-containing protein [Aquimarina sp. 2201CG14-23]
MKKVKLLLPLSIALISFVVLGTYYSKNNDNKNQANKEIIPLKKEGKKKGKTMEERRRFAEERIQHELSFQINPTTGEIPRIEKENEVVMSKKIMASTFAKDAKDASNTTYISRGPSNLGGRTRAVVIDRSDATSNTIIAGGVTSGLFRTTDGGASWVKVSPNNQIHNVSTIVQDPRAGSENIWYYGTGEYNEQTVNSASLGNAAPFFGQGIWQSTDSGVTWTQLPSTASDQTTEDDFDFNNRIAVHPITGDLFAATRGAIRRFDGNVWTTEISGGASFTDLVIAPTSGDVYASFPPNSPAVDGVWQSTNNGNGSWTRIGSNTTPGFGSNGRMVLALAPSNEDILYSFFVSSFADVTVQAGLWRWDNSSDSWTNYTSRMPDEVGGDLSGNDPISVQFGYDIEVSVKPDNANFVVIGGTNVYKIENIITQGTFTRIGGYINNQSYGLYNLGGGDSHHPDIHALVFDPNNPDILFSGTDGGVHRTDVTAATVAWTNLNNNYQTYQYFHVAIDPNSSSDIVIGGAQDNGTTAGGTDFGQPDLTTMSSVRGGDGVAVGISRDDACIPFFSGTQNGSIVRDCPNGQNITPTGSSSQFVTYFFLDPSSNNALYYAGRTNLYRTSQSTSVTSGTWSDLGPLFNAAGISGEEISQFTATWGTYDGANSYLLIGGDRGSLVRLNNPQNSAVIALGRDITPTQANTDQGKVSGIAVHPTNNDIAMVTYANYGITNIYVTTNATASTPTWTVAERNLDAFSIRSAAITEVDGETRYFVGTARGLYSSTDPVNQDWSIEAPNQIGFALVSALAYRPADNKLLVGTHGNGMYEGTVAATLSVEEFDASESSFVAWPIPANDVINVVVDDAFVAGDLDFSVYDLKGSLIKKGELSSEKQIGVDDLAKGSYILQLSSNARDKSILFTKN